MTNPTTDTATLVYDGSLERIVDWSNWEPTPELRFVTPAGTTTKPRILQQRFVRLGFNSAGGVATREFHWDDVPLVVQD